MAIQTCVIFFQNFYLYENTLQGSSGQLKRNLFYDHMMALSPYLFWASEASLLQLKKIKIYLFNFSCNKIISTVIFIIIL